MIADDLELQRTRHQLSEIESALVELRRRVCSRNPERFILMAESYVEEIETLRNRIDEYVGLKTVRESSSDFILRIASPLLPEGVVPAGILTRAIVGVQRGVQRFGEYIARSEGQVSESLPSHRLLQSFELEVVTVAPGSFEVGLRFANSESDLVPHETVQKACWEFAKVAKLVAKRDASPDSLSMSIRDLNSQLQILQSLKEIAPSNRRKEIRVELVGHSERSEPAQFGSETRVFISRLIRTRKLHATEAGTIREVDLDRKTFKLRATATVLRCKYPRSLEDSVKSSLDCRVKVEGTAIIDPYGTVKELVVDALQREG